MRLAPFFFLLLASFPGCFGYAAPARIGFDGMPTSAAAGHGSVAATYGVGPTASGDARVSVGVGSGVSVTVGGLVASAGILMGNAGVRVSLVDGPLLVLDMGVDLGAGLGGQESNLADDAEGAEEENESRDNEELALAGAVDFTLGLRLHRYGGLYLPLRVQVGDSPSNPLIPLTIYHQVALGWQAEWTDHLYTKLDAGYFGLNTLESTGKDDPTYESGWTANVGFGARW